MNVNRDPEERTCPVCGRVFETRSANARYCSRECRARAPWKRHGRSGTGRAKNVDSFLATAGAAHEEISAMRAELAALRN